MYQVGIIIRTSNSPLQLKRTLQNIQEQTLTSWEVIVVNDGGMIEPVDQVTFDLSIPENCQLRVIHEEKQHGVAYCYNKGFSMLSPTEFCIFRDDLDTWDPVFLSSTVDYLKSHQNDFIQAVHPLYYVVTDRSSVKAMRSSKKKPGKELGHIQAAGLVKADPLISSAMLLTRSSVEKIGSFDESIRMYAEWDFHMRFLLNYSVDVIREHLAYSHKQHEEIDETSQLKQKQTEAFCANLLRKRWLQLDTQKFPKAAEVIRHSHILLQKQQTDQKKKNRGFFSFFKH